MTTCRFVTLALGLLLVDVAAASAQTSYVSASLFGDIVRTSHSQISRGGQASGGETLGFALRVGTPLGTAWGVEAEFARPSEMTGETDVVALPAYADILAAAGIDRALLPTLPTLFPSRFETTERHTTLTASIWAQQVFTARFSLNYLAGLGFFRSERGLTLSYPGPLPGPVPAILPPIVTETTTYGVRPMAGFEARLALTDHAYLVPGIRLHAIDNGWLVRPSVGVGWGF